MNPDSTLPKFIIFDKDGTLVSGFENRPANTVAEQHLLPHVAERCEALRSAGHTLAVASNQVVWRSASCRRSVRSNSSNTLHPSSGPPSGEVCLHHPKGRIQAYRSDCDCRKPKPGMDPSPSCNDWGGPKRRRCLLATWIAINKPQRRQGCALHGQRISLAGRVEGSAYTSPGAGRGGRQREIKCGPRPQGALTHI